MGTQLSLNMLAQAIEHSMIGFKLDGISLPPDARKMADVLGEMMYYKQDAVEIESLPEAMQDIIRKHL